MNRRFLLFLFLCHFHPYFNVGKVSTGRQVSYFFLFSGQIPIFPIFERNSYFFLFFSKLGNQNVFFSTLS